MAEQVHKPGILWQFHAPVNSLTPTVETWSVTQDTQYLLLIGFLINECTITTFSQIQTGLLPFSLMSRMVTL